MHLTPTRTTRCLAALASLLLLAACSATVPGTGRPAEGALGTGSGTPTAAATFGHDAADDPHAVWSDAIDASTGAGGSVQVTGTISGAGVGGAQIKAVYRTGADGNPVADVEIVTAKGGTLTITATGGAAWSKATAAVYEEYQYPDSGSEQADGKQVELTDDDAGLDTYSSLESFFDLCGPGDDDPATLEDGSYEGHDALVVTDEKYATKAYVDPASGHVLASVYQDETITFEYGDTALEVEPPAASEVVSVPGF